MEEKEEFSGYPLSREEHKESPALSPDTDRGLIQRAQRGDKDSLALLYVRYHRKILNYLYRFCGNRSTAEELTQETFVRMVEHLHRYRPTGSVGGWIYRIARNLALNHLRDRPKIYEVSLDEPLTLEDDTVDLKEAVAGKGPQPDEEAARVEKEVMIQRALLRVSPVYRDAVVLYDIEGYTYQETAEMLQSSMNTVASRLARGRAQLAAILGYLKKERQR